MSHCPRCGNDPCWCQDNAELPPARSEPLLADAVVALRALCASPVVVGTAARIRDDAARRNDKIVYDIACELIRSKANKEVQK